MHDGASPLPPPQLRNSDVDHAAALCIQAAYRGHRVRTQLLRQVQREFENVFEEIEGSVRGYTRPKLIWRDAGLVPPSFFYDPRPVRQIPIPATDIRSRPHASISATATAHIDTLTSAAATLHSASRSALPHSLLAGSDARRLDPMPHDGGDPDARDEPLLFLGDNRPSTAESHVTGAGGKPHVTGTTLDIASTLCAIGGDLSSLSSSFGVSVVLDAGAHLSGGGDVPVAVTDCAQEEEGEETYADDGHRVETEDATCGPVCTSGGSDTGTSSLDDVRSLASTEDDVSEHIDDEAEDGVHDVPSGSRVLHGDTMAHGSGGEERAQDAYPSDFESAESEDDEEDGGSSGNTRDDSARDGARDSASASMDCNRTPHASPTRDARDQSISAAVTPLSLFDISQSINATPHTPTTPSVSQAQRPENKDGGIAVLGRVDRERVSVRDAAVGTTPQAERSRSMESKGEAGVPSPIDEARSVAREYGLDLDALYRMDASSLHRLRESVAMELTWAEEALQSRMATLAVIRERSSI